MHEPVDISSLLALRTLQRPGARDAVSRIVVRFLEESSARMATLHAAVEDGDLATVEATAHAMKGIAGTVGANELQELALELERAGRRREPEPIAELVASLDAAFDRARPIYAEFIEVV